MAEFRTVQVKIASGKMKQTLTNAGWTGEEIDHLVGMYFVGIDTGEVV